MMQRSSALRRASPDHVVPVVAFVVKGVSSVALCNTDNDDIPAENRETDGVGVIVVVVVVSPRKLSLAVAKARNVTIVGSFLASRFPLLQCLFWRDLVIITHDHEFFNADSPACTIAAFYGRTIVLVALADRCRRMFSSLCDMYGTESRQQRQNECKCCCCCIFRSHKLNPARPNKYVWP